SDVCIDPEDLLDHNQARDGFSLGARNIGAQFVAVRCGQCYELIHIGLPGSQYARASLRFSSKLRETKIGGKGTARAVGGPAAVRLAYSYCEGVKLVEEARVAGCRVGAEGLASKI